MSAISICITELPRDQHSISKFHTEIKVLAAASPYFSCLLKFCLPLKFKELPICISLL